MAAVRIVTDSTADLPEDFVKRLGIEVLPVRLVLDGKTYRDGIDMRAEDFYRNYGAFESMFTKPVSYEDYALQYKRLTYENDFLLAVHCSGQLSRTYENAVQVHEDFKHTHDCRVVIVDSKQCSLGLGLVVLNAAKAALQGNDLYQIQELVAGLVQRTRVYLGVPSLKYLRKGKKISGLKSFIGTAVGAKPVLAIEEGRLEVKSKIFGKKENMLLEMLDHIQGDIGKRSIDLGITHAGAPDLAEELRRAMTAQFDCLSEYVSFVGPSIGVNTGPGSTGIMYTKHG